MTKQTHFTIRDFEDKAQELITIAYALTEQRFHNAVRSQTQVGRVMQEGVVCLQAAIKTLLFIASLPY